MIQKPVFSSVPHAQVPRDFFIDNGRSIFPSRRTSCLIATVEKPDTVSEVVL